MPTIGEVPRDGRRQYTALEVIAANLDRGKPADYGVIPVAGGRYIMEAPRRPVGAGWDSGSVAETPESRPKSPASAFGRI
jgi:hypothetical protein